MTFKPNLSVKEGLDHLAKRLDPIIAARLDPDLGGHPWTVVLNILDEKKGFSGGYQHWTYDLQAQLRMLTERLGQLGYTFDDKQRTVSTLGNELRIVRKQLAHMHDFSTEEAFRANDFCVRLLERFDDGDGIHEAKRIRDEAFDVLVAERGGPGHVTARASGGVVTEESEQRQESDTTASRNVVVPDPVVLDREPTAIGAERLQFEPWAVVQVGGIDVLNDLPNKTAKEKVRAVAVEIATYEGPIHLDRLVQMTAQSFGLLRVRARREKKIAYQIQRAGLFVDDHKFVWPREIDPEAWSEFRPNSSDTRRLFTQISPIEIANAYRFIRSKRPTVSDEELDRLVLQTFGRVRRTRQISAHLAKARALNA